MVKNIVNKQSIKEFLMINLGVFLAALSFALFLDKYNVVIGGVSGPVLSSNTSFGLRCPRR